MIRCTHFVSKLKVHKISKIILHKISLTLKFFKSHIIYLTLESKTSYINHEYAINSYFCLDGVPTSVRFQQCTQE
jgi:hypothetical protein